VFKISAPSLSNDFSITADFTFGKIRFMSLSPAICYPSLHTLYIWRRCA